MQFLISLLISIFICVLFEKSIKRKPVIFYCGTFIISLACMICGLLFRNSLPSFVNEYVIGLFTKGCFGTALWYIVMMTGAIRAKTSAVKIFMPMRRQLSIMAFYATISHNIVYGKYYFVKLFSSPETLSFWYILAAIISLVLILIMVPLTLISFVSVRKKMNAKKWKSIQRFAYVFYGLIYVHLMLIQIPLLKTGSVKVLINICIYTGCFLIYFLLRLQKFFKEKNHKEYRSRKIYVPGFALVVIALIIVVIPSCKNNVQNNSFVKQYVDGIYSGSAYGYDGNIDVIVTVENGNVISIDAKSYEEDLSYFDSAKSFVINEIISTQTTNVDSVSGATYSSKAIMKAVNSALKKF